MNYFVIFVGSGVGGLLRYIVGVNVQRLVNGWIFPLGTFSVNVIGCLLIGFLAQYAESRAIFPGSVRLFLFVGFLGGFTTFSSFGYETFQLIRDGEFCWAACNAVLQLILGLMFVWVGSILAKLLGS